MLPLYTPWKHQKAFGFLMFSGCIKWEHSLEMGYVNWSEIKALVWNECLTRLAKNMFKVINKPLRQKVKFLIKQWRYQIMFMNFHTIAVFPEEAMIDKSTSWFPCDIEEIIQTYKQNNFKLCYLCHFQSSFLHFHELLFSPPLQHEVDAYHDYYRHIFACNWPNLLSTYHDGQIALQRLERLRCKW